MDVLQKVFHFFEEARPTEKEMAYALLIVRIVVAVFFIKFGYGKLFGEPGIEGFTGMLTMLGFPLPVLFAYLVGIAELLGGIAILLGVFTRFSAFWLTIIALAAWWAKGFGLAMVTELPNGAPFAGGVIDFTSFGLTLALFLAGPGAISLSAHMRKGSGSAAAGHTGGPAQQM